MDRNTLKVLSYAKSVVEFFGRNNNKLDGFKTYTEEESYNLLPVQYTVLTHQLWKFLVYRFLKPRDQ